jgi:hypothetical protein
MQENRHNFVFFPADVTHEKWILLDKILELGIVVGLGLNHGPLFVLLQHVLLRWHLGRLRHAWLQKLPFFYNNSYLLVIIHRV